MTALFAQIVFDLAVEGPFDYSVPESLREKISAGSRAVVMFNRRRNIGFVVGLRPKAGVEKVLPVLSLPDDGAVFDAKHLEWMRWLSDHYGCSWGQALAMSLPPALRHSSRIRVPNSASFYKEGARRSYVSHTYELIHDLSRQQQWPRIEARIKDIWDQGLSVLILVPEISAFKQWRDVLKFYRKNVFVVDPVLKDKERIAQWLAIRQSSQSIVFGTRSAVFAPVGNLGLIVMADEDHDFYKEEQSPFHHVRETVLKKAEMESCALVFVSQAPSPELWERSRRERWMIESFPAPSVGRLQKIDVSNFFQSEGVSLTPPLIQQIEKALAEKKQVVLFWNRRGYHRVTHCGQCGENIRCPRCDVNLVYSMEQKSLFCGRCGFSESSTDRCPSCGSALLTSFGRGSEKLARDLKKFFPSAAIARCASGTAEIPRADIILATQMILGWKPPRPFGLVVVLDYDSELSHPDFRAPHKAFRLLIRLRLIAENLIVQTRYPSEEILSAACALDFERFYTYDLGIRKDLKLPPFGHLMEIVVRGLKPESVVKGADDVHARLKDKIQNGWTLSDPQPDRRPKLRDKFRYRMILKGPEEAIVAAAKESLKGFRKSGLVVTLNVDP